MSDTPETTGTSGTTGSSGTAGGTGTTGTVTDPVTANDPASDADRPERRPIQLPVSPRWARILVLIAVFLCAACGLVYELALVALGSYLIGDAVVQASIVLSVMVFAMGVGSLAAKPLQRWPARSFAAIEALLALVGGLSVLGLYAAYAWLDMYQPALVITAFVIGLFVGGEIPLLMTLIQRIRRQDAGSAVADLFAADYVGALIGGLAFPFLLLPLLGQIRGTLIVGILNAVAGIAVVLWLFRRDLRRLVRHLLWAAMIVVIGVLVLALVFANRFEVTARQALYDDPVVVSTRTPYQEIVVTDSTSFTGRSDVRLYLNGDLQFSSVDEYRYHEALVHPTLAGRHRRVLVLGGGDGLAVREILRYPDVEEVTLVELDKQMIDLARNDRRLTSLNKDSLDDPRVNVVTGDAFSWLRSDVGTFDSVIVDLPDPDSTATAKLYSVEFYGLASRVLAPGGRMAVQAGSPYFAPKSYSCVAATMRAADVAITPYQVDVPSFGDWGFFLGVRGDTPPPLRLPDDVPSLRYLDPAVLRAAQTFPKDRRIRPSEPSTLNKPRILDHERREWVDY